MTAADRVPLGGRARRVLRSPYAPAQPLLVHLLLPPSQINLPDLKRYAYDHGVALATRCGLCFVPSRSCARGEAPPPQLRPCPLCHLALEDEVTTP